MPMFLEVFGHRSDPCGSSFGLEQARHNVDQPIPEHHSGEPAGGGGRSPEPEAGPPERHKDVVKGKE